MNYLSRIGSIGVVVTILSSAILADSAPSIQLRNGRFDPPQMASLSGQAGLLGKHVLMQFNGPITEVEREELAAKGIHLLSYIPDFAWTALLDASITDSDRGRYGIRWVGQISSSQKISPLVSMIQAPSARKRADGKVAFAIMLHSDVDAQSTAEQLRISLGAEIIGIDPSTNTVDIYGDPAVYNQAAEIDAVQWIEPYIRTQEEHNDGARSNLKADVAQAAPYNLDGELITVAEWDGGGVSTTHPDLAGRVQVIDGTPVAAHATHVAGTVIGNGTNSGGAYRGMAPGANIISQLWWGSSSEVFNEFQAAIQNYGAALGTNSWGYSVGDPATTANCQDVCGTYFSVDATLDNIVRGSAGRPVSIVWSAGNQRGTASKYCGSLGWTYGTVDGLACSKNVLSIGAINSNNSSMTSFSSWGPTDDGRIKPDVVGPGCQSNGDGGITSCNTTTGYTVMCGTSMSAPAVAGVVALMYQQQYIYYGAQVILPSSIRGILINSATDLGTTGPDYQYGHGRVEADKAVRKVGIGGPSYIESQMAQSDVTQYDLTVPGGTGRLKVTLAWDDPGGTGISGNALINDLDLVLIDPFGAETKPWVLNPASPASAATRDFNRRDNVETAEVVNPSAGLWKAKVTGYNIPSGPQKYSLVFTPDSLYQPGQSLAMAVYDDGDKVVNPGASTPVTFWVTNVGGAQDSIRVRISDNQGWLTGTVDSTVLLLPYDSAEFQLTANVPSLAFATDSTIITCRANSKTDTTIVTTNTAGVRAAATYGVTLATAASDTTHSPEKISLSLKIRNDGNSVGQFDVFTSSADNWMITPPYTATTIGPRDSLVLSFDVWVPEEVVDQTLHDVVLRANGPSGGADTATVSILAINPIFPPSLMSPDTVLFTQNRRPNLQWSSGGDSYSLFIGKDTNMSVVVKTFTGLASPSFNWSPGDSLSDGEYFWAVKKYVSGDSSSIQRYPRRLVIDNAAPSPVDIYAPTNGIALSTPYVYFSFSAPSGSGPGTAPEYSVLQLASDNAFSQNLHSYQPLSGTNYTIPDSLVDGRWYFRILRGDSAGNISSPPVAPSLIVDTRPPDLPSQLAPGNGQTLSAVPVKLRWTTTPPPAWTTSREFYYLHVSKNADFSDYTFTGYLYADSFSFASPISGTTYYWRVKALDSAGYFTAFTLARTFKYQPFICGDVTGGGGQPDLSDLSYLIAFLVASGSEPPIPEAASFNCDTHVDLTDLSMLIAYLVSGNITLCCP